MEIFHRKLSKQDLASILSLLIGIFAFFLIVGHRVLDPTNIAWLEQGDPAMSYLNQHEKQSVEIELAKLIRQKIASENFLEFDFYFFNPKRPKGLGINNDLRKSALGLVSIILR